jgi:hypothetical protein
MVNEYVYVRMEVDSVQEDANEISITWRHLAIRRSDNVMYPIKETSKLEKVENKYLYIKGEVMRPTPEEVEAMTKSWPSLAGLELKPIENAEGNMSPITAAKAKMQNPTLAAKEMRGPGKLKNTGSSGGTMNVKKGTKKV